ncbi:MFS transporter [Cellulomonas cellasea]|uniref:EmrB/QacA subfamily drug resistance transporter n=1 Tax=Cellulomonas cellasea TaxID=43670 RepID=A0A7W4YCG3_9CELL|nr:MFS transporter [Cellulomonas cellasea]MBB2923677.1 EmrB/QacA subfamily drug resistance transporter [Cellulomonas cellasea]
MTDHVSSPGPVAPARASHAPALGALLVIATAQLMMVLDDTVANVALPSIQADLGMSAAALPWVINAYVLAFGGLLLLGGRAGDLYGRRRVLRAGLVVFTLASVVGGLAPTSELLVGARAVQGVGAALVAPSALALIATTFPTGAARNKAMAVYAAMSALGITGGVLLGGILTAALSWRWVLLINVPIGLAVLLGTRTLREGQRSAGGLSVPGAVTGTGAVVAAAYGFTRAGEHGWSDAGTLEVFALAAVLLVAFVAAQARGRDPLLPLRLLTERNRGGAYLGVLVIGGALMGTFYLATLFMQQVMGFGPLQAGVASLPFGLGIVVASGIGSRLVAQLPPRVVALPGFALAIAGLLWLSALDPGAGYWRDLMVPFFLASAGLGLAFFPLTLTVVHGVDERETGVASAVMNTAQQVGAAIGLAVLTAVATTTSGNRLADAATGLHSTASAEEPDLAARTADALSHGYTAAFTAQAVLLVVAALIVGVMVTTRTRQHSVQPGTDARPPTTPPRAAAAGTAAPRRSSRG